MVSIRIMMPARLYSTEFGLYYSVHTSLYTVAPHDGVPDRFLTVVATLVTIIITVSPKLF